MYVQAAASVRVAVPPEVVYAFLLREETPGQMWVGWGPILGATRSRFLGVGAMTVGAQREILSVDEGVFIEEAVECAAPAAYAYRIRGGLRPPLSWLVTEGAGRCSMSRVGHDGTQLSWIFAWKLRSPLAWPFVVLLGFPFRRAMDRCLVKVRARLERQALLPSART